MVYRELQVIFSFFIFSVFPSFFHKHIIFTTENKGQSLLRPGLGYRDTRLLGPDSSVAGFCALHITHTTRPQSPVSLGSQVEASLRHTPWAQRPEPGHGV